MKILVTGHAGFIGFHTVKRLLERGDDVVGFDIVNDYYDPTLKEARLAILDETAKRVGARYTFIRANLADRQQVDACFAAHSIRPCHSSRGAGRRALLDRQSPRLHREQRRRIHEHSRGLPPSAHAHLTYASSSSVYGANTKVPFSEHECVGHPLSLYAATKRTNELMAHTYSHLFRLPTTGLRFFTVYGPWGRPDMALFLFTKNILEGRPIKVFNHGNHTRDFTFIDDIVEGVIRTSDQVAAPDPNWNAAAPDPATSNAPFRVYNIGNNSPVRLGEYIEAIETVLGKTAQRELLPLQPGDVPDTFADASELVRAVGYKPSTTIQHGVAEFVRWYVEWYQSRGGAA